MMCVKIIIIISKTNSMSQFKSIRFFNVRIQMLDVICRCFVVFSYQWVYNKHIFLLITLIKMCLITV